MPLLGPQNDFLGSTGVKPCLLPELDQICFGGHCLACNKINLLSFEIRDKICHYWKMKYAMFGPQNDFLGTYRDKTLIFAQIRPNFFWLALFGL